MWIDNNVLDEHTRELFHIRCLSFYISFFRSSWSMKKIYVEVVEVSSGLEFFGNVEDFF